MNSKYKGKTKAQLIETLEALEAQLSHNIPVETCKTHPNQTDVRNQVEISLQESEEKYRKIVDNSLDGLYIVQDNKLVFCNPRLAEMFGFKSTEEAIGNDLLPRVSPNCLQLVEKELAAHQRGEKFISHYKFQALRLDGKEFDVETMGTNITYKGKPAFQGMMRDISKQKLLEEQLRRAQKMEAIGTLAGGIAHDFNNILSIIMGYTEISLNLHNDPLKLKHNLEHVLKASHRAKDLVKQILSFSSQVESKHAPIKVSPLVDEVLKMIRASIPTTIEIIPDIADEDYIVHADSTQLHQVLMNLCTNAAHAMQGKPGRLTVEVSDLNRDLATIHEENPVPAPYMRLTVKDTGHGMTDEIKQRIFDPFFTTKKVGEGTGLGLSVVHGIITAMDGEISVESSLGKGTAFHLFLPLLQNMDDPQETDKSNKNIPVGNERILLVDDEIALANLGRRMLEQLGYQVAPFYNSFEALQAFSANPESFQLVITDLTMPEMTGIQLAREISKINKNIPVIVCTGYSRKLDRDELKDLGIKELLLKPYNKEKIAVAIRNILDEENVNSLPVVDCY